MEALENVRSQRKVFTGVVTGRSGDKTIKVTSFYKVPHPKYGKEVKKKTVIKAHDENNEAGEGDEVEVIETRPLSKTKCFRLVKIIKKNVGTTA